MNQPKLWQKRLGLTLVAALGVLALLAASSAQAAEWRIEGKKIESSESVTGAAHVASNLLVPAQNLEILCSEHTIEVGAILTNGTAVGQLALSNCKTLVKKVLSPGCKPEEPIIVGGVATPTLHNGLTYIFLTPKAGSPFGLMRFNPAKCALPEEIEVVGSAVTECLNPSNLATGAKRCEEESVTHLAQIAPTSLFPKNVIFFGANPVTFDGIAEVKLGGANAGKKASAFG